MTVIGHTVSSLLRLGVFDVDTTTIHWAGTILWNAERFLLTWLYIADTNMDVRQELFQPNE